MYVLLALRGRIMTFIGIRKQEKILSGPADMQLGMMTFASCEGFLYGLVYPEYLSKESPLYPYVQSYVEDEDANPIILKFKFYEK